MGYSPPMSRSPRRLHVLPYSPWSNKAQWALDVAGVDYDLAAHTPMLSEPGLRWAIARTGVRVGRVTVPVLFERGRPALVDSLDIARRAADLGPDAGLFPAAHVDAIEAWNARSEAALRAARILVSGAVAADRSALLESLPRPMRLPVIGGLVARSGLAFFERKYGVGTPGDAERAALVDFLDHLRAGLGGRPYLFDALTYADLTTAVVLHTVEPPAEMVVGPASRRAWRQPGLAAEYGDLVAWRDGLMARHPPRWDRLKP